jgi:hypothetical protein
MRVHPVTFVVGAIAVFVLLWLNTHPPTDWKRETANNQLAPPVSLNLLGKTMFYKGWPLSPCVFCNFRGMRWDPDDVGTVYLILLLDFLVLVLVAVASGLLCEWLIRRIQKSRKGPGPTQEPCHVLGLNLETVKETRFKTRTIAGAPDGSFRTKG